MATLETLLKSVGTKLQMLKFINEDVKEVLGSNNVTTMERKVKTLQGKIDEIHDLVTKVQEARIEKGDDIQEIREWSSKTENDIKEYEACVAELNSVIKNLQKTESERTKREEEELASELRHQKFEQEMKFEEAKLQQKLNFENKALESSKKSGKESNLHTKLPKLVITQFKGIQTDWLRFWNQFQSGIDETDIGQVTKFSYLKELLDPKVRACVDGLPFTTEGYERAKNILKSKYGKDSKVINAYVQNIIGLPTVTGSQPNKIHEFYETLVTSVQSLETLGKLTQVSGYVRMTLDKLEGIRSNLVRTDDSWQEWKFPHLVEALRKWTERNPLKQEKEVEKPKQRWSNRSKNFQTRQQEQKPRSCVYCDDVSHRSTDCNKVVTVADRRKFLGEKQRCFNCTGARHKAADCRSQTSCQRCKKKHHTSICDTPPVQQMLVAKGEGKVIYPVVLVKAGGIKCRALLDTGAGSSYASAALLERLNSKPQRREFRKIETMLQTSNKMIDIHKLEVTDVKESFALKTEVTRVERSSLLSLPNPKYKDTIEQFNHLKGVTMEDTDEKEELPIHLILGASDYAKIRTATQPRVGKVGEPVGEFTRFGWTIMSPGTDNDDLTEMLFTKTSMHDYQKLCDLDVLGLQKPLNEEQSIYEDFKEQLSQSEEGWYETGLLWKPEMDHLPSNERGSQARLAKLVKRLEKKPDLLKQYHEITKDQEQQGIIEKAPKESDQRKFYIPHKPIVKESAETTKVRIVYDASARETDDSPSLNDCLETGPALQNLLWDILVRSRFKPVALSADLKQAFLQIRIKESDRDVLRFHWIDEENPSEVKVYRFTRALFGLNQSPFPLGGTLDQHLTSVEDEFPDEVIEIKESLYVDDVLSGGSTVDEVHSLKESAIEIFDRAHFQLHKWHSNEKSLEEPVENDLQSEQSFAKQQLGVKNEETKLLGLKWNKSSDQLAVTFPAKQPDVDTKRAILSQLASIFDPLGLAAPITLLGKFVYREVCDSQVPWDQSLPENLMKQWHVWNDNLPDQIEVPRSLATHQEEISSIDLHAFGDTSGQGTAAAVYAVVHQARGVTQGLVTAKARLAKKELTIPRLELVSGQMAANLLDNVKKVLKRYPVQDCYCWLDSTVALHWINGDGSYKQFVRNRVRQIREKSYIKWRHVGTKENPADIGSRGCSGDQSCS